jgi:AraC-like DNA-binding protein
MHALPAGGLKRKLLLFYILIFLVPCQILGFIVYHLARNQAEIALAKDQSAALERTRDAFDRELNDLQKIAMQLRTTLGPGRFDPDPYLGYALTTLAELNKYVVTNRLTEDILFFLHGAERVYSSRSVYSISTLERTLFAGSGLDTAGLLGVFNAMKTTTMMILPRLEPDAPEPLVFYFLPMASEFNPYGWLCFVIRETEIRRIAAQIHGNAPGATVIIDSNGRPVTLTDNAFRKEFNLSTEEIASLVSAGMVMPVLRKGNSVYYLASSTDAGWKYARMVPVTELARLTGPLRWNVILGTILVTLAGTVLIFLFFRITYDPIKHLRRNVELRLGRPLDDPDELAAIRHGLSELVADKDAQLQAFLAANHDAIEDYLLLCLLNGDTDSIASFNERAADTGFHLSKSQYCVVVVELGTNPAIGYPERRVEVLEATKRILSPGYEVAGKLMTDPGRLLLVIGDTEASEGKQHAYLELLLEFFRESGCAQAVIAAGRFKHELRMVPHSYMEALTALEYRFLRGWNTVILYSRIEAGEAVAAQYPTVELQKLEEAILRGDADTTEAIARSILDTIRRSSITLFASRCICFDMVNTCLKTMYRLGMDMDRISTPFLAADTLSSYHTMDDLVRVVFVMIQDVRERIASLGSGRVDGALERINAYMAANFGRQDFSLHELAGYMAMSQSALSHFYREATGSTLQEQLDLLRLERAKQLLEQNLPLKAVVPMVGFQDVSRFIKKFRTSVGMTPGVYARLYRDRRK